MGRKEGEGTMQSYLFQVRKLKDIFWTEINTLRRKEDSACGFVHISNISASIWNDRGASLVILAQPAWYQESPINCFHALYDGRGAAAFCLTHIAKKKNHFQKTEKINIF